MGDRLIFFLNRIGERLWVKPLIMCVLSIAGVFFAKTADKSGLGDIVPAISPDSIETLLSIIASSMLVISTFAVASMVSAYASASSTTTPRSFPLVISDDVSQNALSTFIGAFIFSIVALIALKNGYYDKAGLFALFVLTLFVFTMVILTFIRWMDRIARLGRMCTTIDKVESVTESALMHRRYAPTLRGMAVTKKPPGNDEKPIVGNQIGYIQRVDIASLQTFAESKNLQLRVSALPGSFCAPGTVLAYVTIESGDESEVNVDKITQAFVIGRDRTFEEDPRFGLIVLSEIASKALSPAVNDPGTAIIIIGTLVRLFAKWSEPVEECDIKNCEYDRIEVPEIFLSDMFDDAFTAIARDGAGSIEVAIRLQKAFKALAMIDNDAMRTAAKHHSRLALARAEKILKLPEDLDRLTELNKFAENRK